MIVVGNLTGLGSRIRNLVAALRLGHIQNDQVCLNFEHEHIFTFQQFANRLLPQERHYTNWRLDDPLSDGFDLINDNRLMIVDSVATIPAQGIDFQYCNIKPTVQKKWLKYFNLIHWNPIVVNQANELYNNFVLHDAVGLHIRSWHDDPYRKKLLHKNELFVETIKNIDSKKVFLSCDDIKIEQEIKSLLDDSIEIITLGHIQERHISYNISSEAMINAVIDLLLLSKCRTIVGTYQSSFSDLAWWLSQCQAKMIIPVPEYVKNLNTKI